MKLKKLEQESKVIEEFIQEFRKTTWKSGYEERLLIKEFKQGMNDIIRVNTKELDGVLSTKSSILYILDYQSMLH